MTTSAMDISDRMVRERANPSHSRMERIGPDGKIQGDRPMTPEERRKYRASGSYQSWRGGETPFSPEERKLPAATPEPPVEAAPVRADDAGPRPRAPRDVARERRRQVAELSAGGAKPASIAAKLGLSKSVVSHDLHHIRRAGRKAREIHRASADRGSGGMLEVIERACLGAKVVESGELDRTIETLEWLSGDGELNADSRVIIARLLGKFKAFRAFKEALA